MYLYIYIYISTEVGSSAGCCALCRAEPRCTAWSWGRTGEGPGEQNNKKL